ncbi:hypothetical protein D3C71_1483070 [compost metagenome]
MCACCTPAAVNAASFCANNAVSWLLCRIAAIAINTAAKPTKECINATVSGICVIGTVRARAIPTIAPSTIAPPIIQITG